MGKTRAAPGRGPHRTRRSPLQEGARREGQRGGGQWGGLAGGQRGRAAGSVTCVLITQEVMAAGGGVRAPQADLGFRGHSGCSVRRPRWGAGGMTAVSQGPAAWATLVAMQEVGLAAVRHEERAVTGSQECGNLQKWGLAREKQGFCCNWRCRWRQPCPFCHQHLPATSLLAH